MNKTKLTYVKVVQAVFLEPDVRPSALLKQVLVEGAEVLATQLLHLAIEVASVVWHKVMGDLMDE